MEIKHKRETEKKKTHNKTKTKNWTSPNNLRYYWKDNMIKKKSCSYLIRIELFFFLPSHSELAFWSLLLEDAFSLPCLWMSTLVYLLVKFIKIGVQQLFIINVAFSVSYWLCLKYQIYKRNNLKNINKTSISHFKKEKIYIHTTICFNAIYWVVLL